MVDKIVRPERRRPGGRQARTPPSAGMADWEERRTHCWDLEPECNEDRRRRCAAHFVRRNCWDLWAAEYFPPGRKPCCHPDLDCTRCPIATTKFGETVSIYVEMPPRRESAGAERQAGGLVGAAICPSLYRARDGAVGPGDDDARSAFRCRRRPGIQLHATYVSEVCNRPEYKECLFFAAE